MEQFEVIRIVRDGAWFSQLSLDEIERVAEKASIVLFDKKEFAYHPGETRRNLYCVVEGTVQLSLVDGDGSQFILGSMKEGHWFGEGSVVGAMPLLEIQAVTPCKILSIPFEEVEAVVDNHTFYKNMLADHLRKVQLIYQLLAGMLFLPLRARLAARFLFLVESFGYATEEGIELDMKLSQQDFAKMSMGSRQRVNKIFREWQAGAIYEKRRGKYLIKDVDALRAQTLSKDES